MNSRRPASPRRAMARTALALGLALQIHAAAAASVAFDIPAQPLAPALSALAGQAGLQLVFAPELAQGRQAPALKGTHEVADALRTLLAGSGLQGRVQGRTLVVERMGPQTGAAGTLAPVTVTAQATRPGDLPEAYAGGQVARGGRVGLLGNRDVFETPHNIMSFTSEAIQNQQASTLSDLLVSNASVRVTSTFGNEDLFEMRGVTVNSGARLFNGLPGLGETDQSSLSGLERVEVMQGPSALLNGATGSVGGTINLVPKRAGAQPLTRVRLEGGSSSQAGVHADIGRRFGSGQEFGVRINALARGGETAVENNKNQLRELVAGLDFRGERLRIEGDFGYLGREISGNVRGIAGIDPGVALPRAPDPRKAIQQPWESKDTRHQFGVLHAEYDIGDQWTAYAAHGRVSNQNAFLFSNARITAPDGTLSGNPGSLLWNDWRKSASNIGLTGRFTTRSVTHALSVQAMRLQTERGVAFTPVSGSAIASNLYEQTVYPQPVPRPNLRHLDPGSRVQADSIAIADTMGFAGDRLLVTVGARRIRIQNHSLDAAGTSTQTYGRTATTPTLAALFKVNTRWSVYGNYIEALEQGAVAPATASNAGEVFTPMKSKQTELGVKLDAGRMGFTASLFRIAIPSARTDLLSNRFSVDGRQLNQGLELTMFGEAARGVRLLGGASFQDAKLKQTQGGIHDGKRAPNVPRYALNLGGEADITAVPGLTLTGRVQHTPKVNIDLDSDRKAAAWTRLDLGARYATAFMGRPVTLHAALQNATNAAYYSSFGAIGFPRRLLVSMNVDF